MQLQEIPPHLIQEANEWAHGTDITTAEDIYTPASRDLRRSLVIAKSGLFRLSRRHAGLVAVEIKAAGGWGRIVIYDGLGDIKYFMPSSFTGSFPFSPPGFCDSGLIVHTDCGISSPPLITIIWVEADRALH